MTTKPTPASQPSTEFCTGCWKRVEECRCAQVEQPSPARSDREECTECGGWSNSAAELHNAGCSKTAPARSDKEAERPSNLYRKTALVHAEQFLPAEGKIPAGVISDGNGDPRKDARFSFVLQTLEGLHHLRDGDYICTGPKGEKWNVECSIFESTYELAERAPSGESIATWKERLDAQFARTAPHDGGQEAAMLDEIADLRAALARRATAGTTCSHAWPEADGQTDINGRCTKCDLTFQHYIHSELP